MSTTNIESDRIFIAKDVDILAFEPYFLIPRDGLMGIRNMVPPFCWKKNEKRRAD